MLFDVPLFESKWSFLKGRKIFVGISGGVDSVVLLRLFVLCGFNVEALHVNYQLRGEESDKDEVFVRGLCDSLNIQLNVKKVNTNLMLKQNGGNLQDMARKIRYEFFQSFLDQNENSLVAIAHHQDDQIETFFLNLARKSGLRGMSCMLEIDEFKIRPLLSFSKEEIIQIAKSNKWDWREDQSNQSLKYSRNLFRNKFIPEMIENVPDLKDSVLTSIQLFQRELKQIQNSVGNLSLTCMNSGFLNLDDFKGLTEFQQVELLFMLGLNSSEIQSLNKLIDSQKGKYIETKKIQRIFKEKDGFSFEKFFPRVVFKMDIKKTNSLPADFTKDELYFDADLIKGEIRLRSWLQHDRISPIGLKGSKLISDVLYDITIKSIERMQWSVLVDDEGILSCPFFSISKQKIATQNSKNIICVKIERVYS